MEEFEVPFPKRKHRDPKKDNEEYVYCYDLEQNYAQYKNVELIPYNPDPPILRFNNNEKKDAQTLIDTLSFLLYSPSFQSTNNMRFDIYLGELYDTISMFHYTITNNLISKSGLIKIEEVNHPDLFSLYNAGLKQPEPLAKCIFLFRIIEYSHNVIDETLIKYPEYIELLNNKLKKHIFIPLDIFREYDIDPPKNLISFWKAKARRIEKKWNQQNKKIGETIYNEGRCGTAHAGKRNQRTIFHDYSQDYNLIIEVNTFLELISRYIIEKNNPRLKKIVKIRNREKRYKRSANPDTVII